MAKRTAVESMTVTPLDVTGRKVGEVVAREMKGTTPALTKAALKSNEAVRKTAQASAKAEPKSAKTAKENTVAKAKKSTKKATAKRTPKVPSNPCLCGCKALVVGTFKQGHDARLKSMLLRGLVKSINAAQKAFIKSHGIKVGQNKK